MDKEPNKQGGVRAGNLADDISEKVHVGTCSWTEKTLVESGAFYPQGVRTAEERLRFYAGRFDTVEVDATYYAIPDRRTTALWVERTPETFVFHVKAYGALTGHGVDPKTLPKDIAAALPPAEKSKNRVYLDDADLVTAIAERFGESLQPLRRAGKLGVIVFQYPPWFRYGTRNLDALLHHKELFGQFRIAVEFRHGSWLTDDSRNRVFDFLERHAITYVTADEPQFGSLVTVPFLPHATTDIAYLRLHGRNRDNWLKKGVETSLRYAYLYRDDELQALLRPVRELSLKTKVTYVMFNNCYGDYAVKNSLRFMEMLRSGGAHSL